MFLCISGNRVNKKKRGSRTGTAAAFALPATVAGRGGRR